jgi:hypothetical protein
MCWSIATSSSANANNNLPVVMGRLLRRVLSLPDNVTAGYFQMNSGDYCKILLLAIVSPAIGCALIIYGILFPLVLIGIFIGYIIYFQLKRMP